MGVWVIGTAPTYPLIASNPGACLKPTLNDAN